MKYDLVLVDASIWIDHINKGDPVLLALLNENRLLMHPFVLGEVALGSLKDRETRLRYLAEVRRLGTVDDSVVLDLIASARLWGSGIGYVDAHLLAAAVAGTVGFWTRDKCLHAAAKRLGIAAGVA